MFDLESFTPEKLRALCKQATAKIDELSQSEPNLSMDSIFNSDWTMSPMSSMSTLSPQQYTLSQMTTAPSTPKTTPKTAATTHSHTTTTHSTTTKTTASASKTKRTKQRRFSLTELDSRKKLNKPITTSSTTKTKSDKEEMDCDEPYVQTKKTKRSKTSKSRSKSTTKTKRKKFKVPKISNTHLLPRRTTPTPIPTAKPKIDKSNAMVMSAVEFKMLELNQLKLEWYHLNEYPRNNSRSNKNSKKKLKKAVREKLVLLQDEKHEYLQKAATFRKGLFKLGYNEWNDPFKPVSNVDNVQIDNVINPLYLNYKLSPLTFPELKKLKIINPLNVEKELKLIKKQMGHYGVSNPDIKYGTFKAVKFGVNEGKPCNDGIELSKHRRYNQLLHILRIMTLNRQIAIVDDLMSQELAPYDIGFVSNPNIQNVSQCNCYSFKFKFDNEAIELLFICTDFNKLLLRTVQFYCAAVLGRSSSESDQDHPRKEFEILGLELTETMDEWENKATDLVFEKAQERKADLGGLEGAIPTTHELKAMRAELARDYQFRKEYEIHIPFNMELKYQFRIETRAFDIWLSDMDWNMKYISPIQESYGPLHPKGGQLVHTKIKFEGIDFLDKKHVFEYIMKIRFNA